VLCRDYRALPASQLPEIMRTDCTRRACAPAALAEPLPIELLPAVLPVPDVLPVPLVLPVPAVLPLPVLPVPAVPDVEPVPDVPAEEPEP
jgi:hypothetical protein